MDDDWIYLYFICAISNLYPSKNHPLSRATYLRCTCVRVWMAVKTIWPTPKFLSKKDAHEKGNSVSIHS